MRAVTVSVGFIPLVDAAPLIVAQEMGFAAEEGINLALKPAPSWSSLRDMLSFGQVEAAHMLSPIPVATALGLGGAGAKLSAVSVLSVNGNVIGVSNALAARLHDQGHDFGFNDAYKAGTALIGAAKGRLRVGVPFPFSMHAELLYYWLSALGLPAPQSVDIHTVPPPLMADAMEAGDIDAFCVGEPWGSQAVDTGVGQLLLPGSAIWSCAPEKVLAVRSDWAEQESALMGRLIRAVWRAGRWLGEPDSRMLTSELLSRPEYLDLPSDMLERALMGRLVIGPAGEERHVDGLATRMGLDQAMARNVAGGVFRSDLHRQALAGTTADLPGASSKVEGGLEAPMAVASEAGHLILGQNRFFDGRVFDPKGD